MRSIKQIPHRHKKSLYLTFDDGPTEDTTPAVLKLLKDKNVPATFFVIGQQCQDNPDLIKQILEGGHSIGNHSPDHSYSPFFKGQTRLETWITKAETQIRDVAQIETVGFRPPAGVVTPELRRALTHLKIPLVMWNRRFFDTVFPLSARAANTLPLTPAGSIILFHDRQKPHRLNGFLKALDHYIDCAREQGFTLQAVPNRKCLLDVAL